MSTIDIIGSVCCAEENTKEWTCSCQECQKEEE